MRIGAGMFDQGICFFLLMVRHVFLCGSCMGELCLQGEGWGVSTTDFHLSVISHGLVGAVTAESLTVTRLSSPAHKPWHRSWCAVSEQKEYPNWALPSFDSSQQGKPWEYSSTFLKMLSWVLKTSST